MKKKIMILGASILQLPAIIRAKEMGLHTIVLDSNDSSIGFEIADEKHLISTNDIESAIQLARRIKPDGVITMATDRPMRTVAAIGEELLLNTISSDAAMKATDKLLMRKQLQKDKLPIPKYFKIYTLKDFLDVTKLFEKDFIVKPSDSSGSKGVLLCNNDSNLEEIYNSAKKYSISGNILLEEFMEGPEVSVETLTFAGKTKVIAITDKYKSQLPYFVEMGHSIPSQLDMETKLKIEKLAIQAVNSIGINVGPAHTEIIVTNEGPKIVEIGARLGGDHITSHLVLLATGVDMVEATIKISLGQVPNLKDSLFKGAAIQYFGGKNGIINKIDNFEEFEKLSGVQEIIINKKVGDTILDIQSSNDRLGHVIIKKSNAKEAVLACKKIISKIKIEIE